MTDRRRIEPRSPFEAEIGFTRALRTGSRILVSGTVATEPDGSVTPGGGGAQARRCFAQIVSYIEELGGRREDVVRIRMFVTDMADADDISAAFSEWFRDVRPVATLVAVAGLYSPEWKVEIEAEAEVQ